MSEILTESFCERCGTRYTFESAEPPARLKRVKVLSRGLKNFVMSDDTSMDEAMAAARSETDRAQTSQQLDAFHKTFNFCMSCRQYTCPNCWNEAEARCLSCAPILGREIMPAPFPDLDARTGLGMMTPAPVTNGAYDANGGHGLNGSNGLNGAAAIGGAAALNGTMPLDGATASNGTNGVVTEPAAADVTEPPAAAIERPAPEMIGLSEVAPVDIIEEINSTTRLEALLGAPRPIEETRPLEPMSPVDATPSAEVDAMADVDAVAEPLALEPDAATAEVTIDDAEGAPEVEVALETAAAIAPEILLDAEPPAAVVDPGYVLDRDPPAEVVEPGLVSDAEPLVAAATASVVDAPSVIDAAVDVEPIDDADEGIDLAARLAGGALDDGELDPTDAIAAAALHQKTAAQTSGWLQRFRPTDHLDSAAPPPSRGPIEVAPVAETVVAARAVEAARDVEPVAPEVAAIVPDVAAVVPEIEPTAVAVEPVAAAVEPIAALVEPSVGAPEPVAAADEPIPAVVEPVAPEPVAAVVEPAGPEIEPVAPEIEPVAVAPEAVAAEPQVPTIVPVEATVAEPTPPEVVPLVAAAEIAAEPPTTAATPVAEDVVSQPTWQIMAPDPGAETTSRPQPGGPTPTIPAPAPAEPQWPTRPSWLGGPPATGLPFLNRPASPQGGIEALWAESNREVAATPPIPGKATAGVQPCVSCGLSLSASARFCRRCGTLQGS